MSPPLWQRRLKVLNRVRLYQRHLTVPYLSFSISDSVSKSDSGFYSCGAVSASGSNMVRTELKVVDKEEEEEEHGGGVGPSQGGAPPVITLGPANQTLAAGDTARWVVQIKKTYIYDDCIYAII